MALLRELLAHLGGAIAGQPEEAAVEASAGAPREDAVGGVSGAGCLLCKFSIS
jgi:hypothetical protein